MHCAAAAQNEDSKNASRKRITEVKSHLISSPGDVAQHGGVVVEARSNQDYTPKELRRVVEPLITIGKTPTLANRRLAFDRLRDREVAGKLFEVLGPRFATRNGGYLRILKMGFRDGDNAPMAYVELLDRPDSETAEASA